MAFKLSLGNKAASGPDLASDTTIMENQSDPTPARSSASKAPMEKPVGARVRNLGMAFGALVIATIGLVIYQTHQSNNISRQIAAAGEMQTLSQQIAKSAQLALQGNAAAFAELKRGSSRFATLVDALDQGGEIEGSALPAVADGMRPQLESVTESWRKMEKDAQQLISQEKTLLTLNDSVETINKGNDALLELTEQVAALKLQAGASAGDIATANRAVMLTQRIAKNVNALRVAAAIDPEVAFLLGKDTNTFREQLAAMEQMGGDSETRNRIRQLISSSKETQEAVSNVLGNIQLLVQAKQAGSRLFDDSSTLLARSTALSEAFNSDISGFNPLSALIALCALAALAALGMMAKIYNDDLSQRRADAERMRANAENDRNLTQQAILRLMNEMGDLADGDLTIRATVSEDITGAIADSVNYTIEELSVLVRRINDAAGRVTSATQAAQQTSNELLDATERQSREIEEAGATVQRMAQSMTESSARALESAQVARLSLDSARKGADAVENTIRGMNAIREKIQETSKRIKRLGESSQEIGEIVELISDITEQTNVLALNAAIQAASAGEAGRGFTVVAEEVQRLAERSAEATKQISAIVKTIQTDTQDAVGAMENATRDVVEGAQLSDAAGQALAEIGQVSMDAAQRIEQISTDTQDQAATAGRVADTMKDILAITEQTTRGTKQTAVSIGQLADLAVELKGSVSGFKV
ncbi:type IV pili methyl-accepting chemotaxis transducer N-terminal domain-containing protein [Azoarcus sp. L1K30]|uniref:methyl-accepting chemotaxis protein n=1 Tax=Azoarcus sp. L1K30 TaxID=2820277 RepID=UPI001B838708|nr:methyl-accepting chemotaxis protein [Azoarcus sp. L1K30]MBR0567798.1 type IV pili methyl-accepting chemotaxis transducer N-terminal domain-containing protein [Azoarcus sp. L1K30]